AAGDRRALTQALLGRFGNQTEAYQHFLASTLAYFTQRGITAEKVQPGLERAAQVVANFIRCRPPSLPIVHYRTAEEGELLRQIEQCRSDEKEPGRLLNDRARFSCTSEQFWRSRVMNENGNSRSNWSRGHAPQGREFPCLRFSSRSASSSSSDSSKPCGSAARPTCACAI